MKSLIQTTAETLLGEAAKTKQIQNMEMLRSKYASMHILALKLADDIADKLQDLPEPEDDSITWGHLGDLERIVKDLRDVNSYLS